MNIFYYEMQLVVYVKTRIIANQRYLYKWKFEDDINQTSISRDIVNWKYFSLLRRLLFSYIWFEFISFLFRLDCRERKEIILISFEFYCLVFLVPLFFSRIAHCNFVKINYYYFIEKKTQFRFRSSLSIRRKLPLDKMMYNCTSLDEKTFLQDIERARKNAVEKN